MKVLFNICILCISEIKIISNEPKIPDTTSRSPKTTTQGVTAGGSILDRDIAWRSPRRTHLGRSYLLPCDSSPPTNVRVGSKPEVQRGPRNVRFWG